MFVGSSNISDDVAGIQLLIQLERRVTPVAEPDAKFAAVQLEVVGGAEFEIAVLDWSAWNSDRKHYC